MPDTLIEVKELYKKFCRDLKSSMYYAAVDSGYRFLSLFNPKEKILRPKEFWSLEDVKFKLKRGESIGIIGTNGSGKSTLLRVISGVYPPDRGSVTISGRIASLISAGAGFHPHMSGQENIFLNGAILGFDKQEIEQHLATIINFAELGDFIHAPVSTYSPGMLARLGVAIPLSLKPDILLLDEVLSVTDQKFRKKIINKIKELKSETALILVTHNPEWSFEIIDSWYEMEKGKLYELETVAPEPQSQDFNINSQISRTAPAPPL